MESPVIKSFTKPSRWVLVQGEARTATDSIRFDGYSLENSPKFQGGSPFGISLCDSKFSQGEIRATVRFDELKVRSECEFIIYFDPSSGSFVTAGLGGSGAAYSIRNWAAGQGGGWRNQFLRGTWDQLEAMKDYQVVVGVEGAHVRLTVDGVEVGATTLPYPLTQSNVGVWTQGLSALQVTGYEINHKSPICFVIMQYSEPYDVLYKDVIEPVTSKAGLLPIRADEIHGPGFVMSDIIEQIVTSQVIIADITPANRNVYFEVGYAFAHQRPLILIAEEKTAIPFDLSGHRVLFYENSIGGKKRVEEGLERHLQAILRGSNLQA